MTRHSTNDTELFRKMTSLILMGKISPPGHCLLYLSSPPPQTKLSPNGLPLISIIGISMETILGFIFSPLAWTMGVSWQEAELVGILMGEKIVFTELIAYGDLQSMIDQNKLSQRSSIIASYALCGFANFGSIGIQLGGIGGIAPERKKDLAKLITKAMIGGALASWLTASVAGILI